MFCKFTFFPVSAKSLTTLFSKFLHVDKTTVISVMPHELFMSAALDYECFMLNTDHIGVGNRGQAVSYY